MGFGDIVPNTYCGRGIAVSVGIMVSLVRLLSTNYKKKIVDLSVPKIKNEIQNKFLSKWNVYLM